MPRPDFGKLLLRLARKAANVSDAWISTACRMATWRRSLSGRSSSRPRSTVRIPNIRKTYWMPGLASGSTPIWRARKPGTISARPPFSRRMHASNTRAVSAKATGRSLRPIAVSGPQVRANREVQDPSWFPMCPCETYRPRTRGPGSLLVFTCPSEAYSPWEHSSLAEKQASKEVQDPSWVSYLPLADIPAARPLCYHPPLDPYGRHVARPDLHVPVPTGRPVQELNDQRDPRWRRPGHRHRRARDRPGAAHPLVRPLAGLARQIRVPRSGLPG